MSVTQYNGICFMCGKNVPAGRGDFQSVGSLPKKDRSKYAGRGKWLVRCFQCKGLGNKPLVDKN